MILTIHHQKSRGVTLLEMLMYSALLLILATTTFHLLGQSRILRGMAHARTDMALLAQEHLDALPSTDLVEGSLSIQNPEWPEQLSMVRTIKPFDEKLWSIEIVVTRKTSEGQIPVSLTALRRRNES